MTEAKDGHVCIKVKEGESVHIDDSAVEIHIRKVAGMGKGVVQLLIRAPKCLSVYRGPPSAKIAQKAKE